jgi:sulfatase maturation enzyme AslB (radical SAM superfamily)
MNLKKVIDTKSYRDFKGTDWPSYENFINNNYTVDDKIKLEIDQFVDMMNKQYINLSSTKTIELSTANQKRQQQLFYNKSYSGTNRCMNPWKTLGVNANGNVFICSSPSWIPIFIGSILEVDNIFEILNSQTAKKIRLEILQNRYYYCNSNICGFFQHEDPFNYKTKFDINNSDPLNLSSETHDLDIDHIPSELIFDFDATCNFKCPSCRIEHQNYNNHHIIRPINNTIAEKIKKLIIDKIEDQPIIIRWAGGEPFMSEVYLDLFDYIITTNKKNIKSVIQTNGSLFKSKSQIIEKLLPFVSNLRISFDAGCKDTYKLTRVGGDWDKLLENVIHVKNLIKQHNFETTLSADFVVQKSNYKDLPMFASLCRSMGLHMNIQKMWNWGTWDTDTFHDMNVYNSSHYLYDDVVKYFNQANLPIAKN